MKKTFDIQKSCLERCAEALLRESCNDFIYGIFNSCGEKDTNVLDFMVEELYKGSTMQNKEGKLVITFKFPKEDK